MLWMLLSLFAPQAEACGLSGKSHVVGWNTAGDQVLLRLETENDNGDILEIELAAFDLAKKSKLKGWPILLPEDEGDRNKRGARWKAAEKEIHAMGIEVIPEVPKLEASEQGWKLGDAHVFVSSYSFDEGMMRRYDLKARRGEETWELGIGHEGSNSACGGYYPTAYRSPNAQFLVLLDQGFLSLEPTIVSKAQLRR